MCCRLVGHSLTTMAGKWDTLPPIVLSLVHRKCSYNALLSCNICKLITIKPCHVFCLPLQIELSLPSVTSEMEKCCTQPLKGLSVQFVCINIYIECLSTLSFKRLCLFRQPSFFKQLFLLLCQKHLLHFSSSSSILQQLTRKEIASGKWEI